MKPKEYNDIDYLVTTKKIIFSKNIMYPGGEDEKNWWPECDKRGWPFIMVYQRGNGWSIEWDYISMFAQNSTYDQSDEFYKKINIFYKRYWKTKQQPLVCGDVGRINHLTKKEAVQAAVTLAKIFKNHTIKLGGKFIMETKTYPLNLSLEELSALNTVIKNLYIEKKIDDDIITLSLVRKCRRILADENFI